MDVNTRLEAAGINIDQGPQQTLNTENPWLNVIITQSKFIHLYAYFQQLFQYFLHLSRSYTETTQVNLPLKQTLADQVNLCQNHEFWNLWVKVLGSLLFYTINWQKERVKWVARPGGKHLTGDCLTYRNGVPCTCTFLHGWILPGCVIISRNYRESTILSQNESNCHNLYLQEQNSFHTCLIHHLISNILWGENICSMMFWPQSLKLEQIMHIKSKEFVCLCEVLRPSQQLTSCRAGQVPANTVPGQA